MPPSLHPWEFYEGSRRDFDGSEGSYVEGSWSVPGPPEVSWKVRGSPVMEGSWRVPGGPRHAGRPSKSSAGEHVPEGSLKGSRIAPVGDRSSWDFEGFEASRKVPGPPKVWRVRGSPEGLVRRAFGVSQWGPEGARKVPGSPGGFLEGPRAPRVAHGGFPRPEGSWRAPRGFPGGFVELSRALGGSPESSWAPAGLLELVN